jgi:uncharacterized membrane-anchored protein YitT (DUF2179 family)
MADREQQMSEDPDQRTGAEAIAAVALFFGPLTLVVGLIFGWEFALYLLEVGGVLGGVGILTWNLRRRLPRVVGDVLFVALAALAMGLVFGWESAEAVAIAAGVVLIWMRWSKRDRPAN